MTLDMLAEMVAKGFAETNGKIDALETAVADLHGRTDSLDRSFADFDVRLTNRTDIVIKEVLRQGEVLEDVQRSVKSHTLALLGREDRLEKLEA